MTSWVYALPLVMAVVAIWGLAAAFIDWARVSQLKGWTRKSVAYLGFALTLYGIVSFFVPASLSGGGADWIPPHWNLPMGYSTCAHDRLQQRFCISTTGRVQKYRQNGEFVGGWWVNVFGGRANISVTSDGKIEIITKRQNTLYTFDKDGARQSVLTDLPETTYDRATGTGEYVPTPALLLPITTHPLIAFMTVLVGVLLMRLEDREFWRSHFARWRR
jgi:hypothetical protein